VYAQGDLNKDPTTDATLSTPSPMRTWALPSSPTPLRALSNNWNDVNSFNLAV